MIKIDIFSGFLGAGKTTLIKKLISEAYGGEKLVLIENEFGEIGIDGGFLRDAGLEITEMNSGCICCSLVGDFGKALEMAAEQFSPDRILIEPSGVGKLSDVIAAVKKAAGDRMVLGGAVAVVDATRCKMYMKNFGEFFSNQIENAGAVILSRTQGLREDRLAEAVALVRQLSPKAALVTTPWDELDGGQILAAIEGGSSLAKDLAALADEEAAEACPVCGHSHGHAHEHNHEHTHEHTYEHNHEHTHEHGHEQAHEHVIEHAHEHAEHGHGHATEQAHAHEHEHEHEHEHTNAHAHDHAHGDTCGCGCEHDAHDHAAGEVFSSWGVETAKKYAPEAVAAMLDALGDEGQYGLVLRAKGIVASEEGWIHFDYVPGEAEVRQGGAMVSGRICVIGSELNEQALARLFGAA